MSSSTPLGVWRGGVSVIDIGAPAIPSSLRIARSSMAERLDEWAQLNRGVERMAEQAVRRRHPDDDDRQVFLALVRRRYGDELALQVWPDAANVEP